MGAEMTPIIAYWIWLGVIFQPFIQLFKENQ